MNADPQQPNRNNDAGNDEAEPAIHWIIRNDLI